MGTQLMGINTEGSGWLLVLRWLARTGREQGVTEPPGRGFTDYRSFGLRRAKADISEPPPLRKLA